MSKKSKKHRLSYKSGNPLKKFLKPSRRAIITLGDGAKEGRKKK